MKRFQWMGLILLATLVFAAGCMPDVRAAGSTATPPGVATAASQTATAAPQAVTAAPQAATTAPQPSTATEQTTTTVAVAPAPLSQPTPAGPAPAAATAASSTATPQTAASSPSLAATAVPPPATAVAPVASQAPGGVIKLTLAPDGTLARYRVREQLAGRSFPNDAVGTTSAVTGELVIGADGKIQPAESTFVVDLTGLRSDERQRDRFIQGNTLNTSRYPTANFVASAAEGLPSPLPASGDVIFRLNGDLTIHGVTKPATWNVTAHVANNAMTGTATTSFRFEDYGMAPPRAAVVLSVVDNVTLELDFHMVSGAQTAVVQ